MSEKIQVEVVRHHETIDHWLLVPTQGGVRDKATWVPKKVGTLEEKNMIRLPHTWTLTISHEDAEHFGMV